jgi:hypothetical protein
MVQLLEGYSDILDRGDLPATELQEVRDWYQAIVDDITLTAIQWYSYARYQELQFLCFALREWHPLHTTFRLACPNKVCHTRIFAKRVSIKPN